MNGAKGPAWVDYYVDSLTGVITLTHPAAGNVLNPKNLAALSQALETAQADANVRIIILRSQGDPFCLGMDLKLLQNREQDQALAAETIAQYAALLSAIAACPKPVVCLVQGAVKAGGIGLVASCDIVLASEQASFEFSEVILGLIPANVIPVVLGLRMPMQKLKYLILTAKQLSSPEAQACQLVDEVFNQTKWAASVKAVIKNLLRASPRALAETKRFLQAIAQAGPEQASELAQRKFLEMIQQPEVVAAIQAFNEGNTPSWFAKYQPTKPLVSKSGL